MAVTVVGEVTGPPKTLQIGESVIMMALCAPGSAPTLSRLTPCQFWKMSK